MKGRIEKLQLEKMGSYYLYYLPIMLTSMALVAAAEDLTSQAASFYQVLQSNDLPIGLFPKDISEFRVEASSGRFEVHLRSPWPCEAEFETSVKFEWNITGCVSSGRIGNLSGVSARELFLWLPVKGIQVDIPSSGLIYFDVGMVSKQFSLSFFETPKECNVIKGNDEFLDESKWEKVGVKDEELRADA